MVGPAPKKVDVSEPPPKPHKRRSPPRRATKDARPSQPAPRRNAKNLEEGKTPPAKRPRKNSRKNPAAQGKPSPSKKPPNRPKGRRKPPNTKTTPALPARWRIGGAISAFAVLLLCSLAAFVVVPGPGDGKSVEIDWKTPASAGEAADQLADAGLVRSAFLMSLYLRFDGNWKRVDPGSHLLQDDMSPRTLLRRMRRLRGGLEVRVTIPEGFNKFELASRLHEQGVCSQRGFLAATTDEKLLAELRIPAPDAEGYLYPATYNFPRNNAPAAVMRRLVNESTKRYASLFDDYAEAAAKLEADLGWSRHSIIVLASVIEKEAAVDDERPIIASVFLNRMYSTTFRPLQRLQSDPTARYGCLLNPDVTPTCVGAEKGVTGPMVRDPLNPYSTYAHSGLPPGPICNPSQNSMRAVLTPAKTDYLYFVAKGGGRHKFSESYDDHRDAIRNGR